MLTLIALFALADYTHPTDPSCAAVPAPETCEDIVDTCSAIHGDGCLEDDLNGYTACIDHYTEILGGTPEGFSVDCSDVGSLDEVTDQWRYRGEVRSLFPKVVDLLPKGGDSARVTKVFETMTLNGNTRRLEVYETYGDCGNSTFVLTDLEQVLPEVTYSRPRAYYIEKYSSWNSEECGERPYKGRFVKNPSKSSRWVRNPLRASQRAESMETFLERVFVTNSGVAPTFKMLCDGETAWTCILPHALGDLGN